MHAFILSVFFFSIISMFQGLVVTLKMRVFSFIFFLSFVCFDAYFYRYKQCASASECHSCVVFTLTPPNVIVLKTIEFIETILCVVFIFVFTGRKISKCRTFDERCTMAKIRQNSNDRNS